MRIKSHWHKGGKPRSMPQVASVMAFIIWRLAQNALKRMRTEQYDIDPGLQYFAFLSELLIFLIQIADRIAYQQLDAAQRNEFTTALANRVAEILDDNQSELLGSPQAGSYKGRFIALLNELASDYAEFKYTADGPDFAFLRYLGSRVMETMVQKDRHWVIDQIMAIEAPEAVADVQKGMRNLLDAPQQQPAAE
ncbi:MAG: hypothetical protein Q8K18_02650 [Burkholderiales bacterium]|nr:hypothetical protein [Burkholderiales bacterium]